MPNSLDNKLPFALDARLVIIGVCNASAVPRALLTESRVITECLDIVIMVVEGNYIQHDYVWLIISNVITPALPVTIITSALLHAERYVAAIIIYYSSRDNIM